MAKLHRQTKSNLLFFFVGALVWALGACSLEPEHGAGSSNFSNRGSNKITELSFKAVQQQIFQPQCVECHARYNDYSAVVLELDAILDSIQSGRMPKAKSRLPSSDIALVSAWVAGGAPYEQGVLPPEQIELAPYWESISKRIFQPHCVACHSTDGEVPWVDFTTYESVLAMKDNLFNTEKPRDSYIIEVILDAAEPMPPLDSNVPHLSQEQLRVFIDWIGRGIPEIKKTQ